MATEPYIYRVPVEIWREILRCTVGPSLSNPEQDTLRAYDELFMYYPSLAELYIAKERTRHTLMLVCKLWRDIVEDLDDKIVIGGMDEFDWPPNKRRNEAKYIHYVDLGWDLYSHDPISTSRVRRGRDAGVIPEPPVWNNETLDLVINAESPPAPVMLVGSMRIKLGKEVSTTFNGRVRVFQWIIPAEDTDVGILHAPLFDNLTYLALSVHWPDFPQALVQPQWTFPTLRVLVVQYVYDDTDRDDAFEQWRCPKLTMLKYTVAKPHHPIPRGILTFIYNHAQNLKELEIGADGKSHWEVEENWKRLVALKSYKFSTFQQLVEALPFMDGLWSAVDHAASKRRLHIELGSTSSDAVSSVCVRAAPYKHILAKLDVFLTSSWQDLVTTSRSARQRKIADFLVIVKSLNLNVLDLYGQPSDGASAQEVLLALSFLPVDENGKSVLEE